MEFQPTTYFFNILLKIFEQKKPHLKRQREEESRIKDSGKNTARKDSKKDRNKGQNKGEK